MWDKYIALYERLSLEDLGVKQGNHISESESILNQRRLLFSYVEQSLGDLGLPVREFKDDGYSGTNFDRPKFNELMSEVRRGNVAIIIVKDFSRLGRSYLEAGNYLDKIFPAYGVRFISVNDRYDSADHVGQTTGVEVGLKNIVNDMYSKDLSQKQKSAQMVRYKRGEYVAANPFYGYVKNPEDKHKLLVDSEVANVVKRIFQYSAEGYSTYEIASMLNAEGILSPYEYKKSKGIKINSHIAGERALWNAAKVKIIIKDERYLGKMISHKTKSIKVGSKKTVPVPREEWIIVEGTHEPLVSQELFEQANEALSKRVKRGDKNVTLKRTNIFICPYCNHKLQFTGGSDNKKFLYCGFGSVNQREKCKTLKVSRECVEKKVLHKLNEMGNVYLESLSEKKSGMAEKRQDSRFVLEKEKSQLEMLKKRKRDAYVRYSEGAVSREEYMRIAKNYNEEIQALEENVRMLEEQQKGERLKSEETIKGKEEVKKTFLLNEYVAEKVKEVARAIYVYSDDEIEIALKNE